MLFIGRRNFFGLKILYNVPAGHQKHELGLKSYSKFPRKPKRMKLSTKKVVSFLVANKLQVYEMGRLHKWWSWYE